MACNVNIELKIVDAQPPMEPPVAYFESLAGIAMNALRRPVPDAADAWALCEYLDAVDAGNLKMERNPYWRAVSALSEFLSLHQGSAAVRRLSAKSWAAHVLADLLHNQIPQVQMRRAA